MPRIVEAYQWNHIAAGLKQRIRALNLFIDDVYHKQTILKQGIIPTELVTGAESFREQCVGISPPRGIWCHITGTDLIRHDGGAVYVLEDNLRCPSGVSYVLQNRLLMKRSFPQAFAASNVRPVFNCASHLYETLVHMAPQHAGNAQVVVLTPGIYNSAYYEHSCILRHSMRPGCDR